jgi:hypothetical protein
LKAPSEVALIVREANGKGKTTPRNKAAIGYGDASEITEILAVAKKVAKIRKEVTVPDAIA